MTECHTPITFYGPTTRKVIKLILQKDYNDKEVKIPILQRISVSAYLKCYRPTE